MTPEEKLEALLASVPIPKHKQREIKALFDEIKPKKRTRKNERLQDNL